VGRFAPEQPVSHAQIPWPGFVTPFGPSVYRCKCGAVFGDPHVPLDRVVVTAAGEAMSALEAMKQARNAHFKQAFEADCNGYPTATSAHFPLHRSVQKVLLSSAHKGATQRTPAIEAAVATELMRRAKGNIHTHTLRGDIAFAVDTYLACRRVGMAEPRDLRIDFLAKARLEQALILAARECAQARAQAQTQTQAKDEEEVEMIWVEAVRHPSYNTDAASLLLPEQRRLVGEEVGAFESTLREAELHALERKFQALQGTGPANKDKRRAIRARGKRLREEQQQQEEHQGGQQRQKVGERAQAEAA